MNKKLGIYVSSDRHLDKVIAFCRAALKKNVDIHVFFTHVGTRLCTDPQMEEICKLAKVALCKVGFSDNNLDPGAARVQDTSFASQSWHAEMILDCDRYLTL